MRTPTRRTFSFLLLAVLLSIPDPADVVIVYDIRWNDECVLKHARVTNSKLH